MTCRDYLDLMNPERFGSAAPSELLAMVMHFKACRVCRSMTQEKQAKCPPEKRAALSKGSASRAAKLFEVISNDPELVDLLKGT